MGTALAIVGVIALIELIMVLGLSDVAKQRAAEIADLKAERKKLLVEAVKHIKRQEIPCDAEGVYNDRGYLVERGDIHGAD